MQYRKAIKLEAKYAAGKKSSGGEDRSKELSVVLT
jgi:hypothetical protein